MRQISKSYPGVRALDNVSLELAQGEVLALLGENGAGKSTLIKVLGGATAPDSGEIVIAGKPTSIHSPVDAQRAGVAIIYQEFNLIPALNAAENIFLGQESSRGGFIRRRQERTKAASLFERIGVEIDLNVPCRNLSVAQQQVVEIAKSLSQNARVIVMDEPSATLTNQEVESLFRVIEELKAQGIGVIYISHRLEEVFRIADRITVLRDGQFVGSTDIQDIERQQLIEMMVGRSISEEFPSRDHPIGEVRLAVKGLSRKGVVHDVSFNVRAGEILGVTGLVGAGRTETMRLIFGADSRTAGSIHLDGRRLDIKTPRNAIRAGIGLLTEDRKTQGLVIQHSVRENFGLPNLGRFARAGFVNQLKERKAFSSYVDRIDIRLSHQDQLARNLSGGNQQKVVLAKWLERSCEVVIFDEPTRGIDVGAKIEIYQLMNGLAREGKAVIMVSSELPEVIGMSDRILVMRGGRIAATIDCMESVSQAEIMEYAMGVHASVAAEHTQE